ncbi:hypothetical protein EA473_08435 [Natrarchaeobius chitinivorans]|uniref:Uncharacterized protein n=1 Tax=Natrarchaeobius chitinivorans TaxID=1679083 RepID=A0A3N6LXG8_NATCH|nr:hypothetical protein EA473_08435 [Natrarchaeobius chitinivorans]
MARLSSRCGERRISRTSPTRFHNGSTGGPKPSDTIGQNDVAVGHPPAVVSDCDGREFVTDVSLTAVRQYDRTAPHRTPCTSASSSFGCFLPGRNGRVSDVIRDERLPVDHVSPSAATFVDSSPAPILESLSSSETGHVVHKH